MSGTASEYYEKRRTNELVFAAGLTVFWWLLGIGDVCTRAHFPAFLLLSIFKILHSKTLKVKVKVAQCVGLFKTP